MKVVIEAHHHWVKHGSTTTIWRLTPEGMEWKHPVNQQQAKWCFSWPPCRPDEGHLDTLSNATNRPSFASGKEVKESAPVRFSSKWKTFFLLRAYRGLLLLDYLYWNLRRLFGKIIILRFSFCYWVHFKTYIMDTAWLTHIITAYCQYCAKCINTAWQNVVLLNVRGGDVYTHLWL